MKLFTIGYEGHTADSFTDLLRKHQVDVLLDVRQRAGSRKPSFSKSRLRELLTEHGIEYQHLPLLGTPADLRARYKKHELNLDEYLEAYGKYVVHQLPDLAQVAELIGRHRCCLLCVEHKSEVCHRSILARQLTQHVTPLTITNL